MDVRNSKPHYFEVFDAVPMTSNQRGSAVNQREVILHLITSLKYE